MDSVLSWFIACLIGFIALIKIISLMPETKNDTDIYLKSATSENLIIKNQKNKYKY